MSVKVRFAWETDTPQIRALLADADLMVPGTPYDRFPSSTWVATEDEHVVGVLMAVLGYPLSVVLNIAVEVSRRHQGIGRALLETFEAHLIGLGYPTWLACTDITRASSEYIQAWPGVQSLGTASIWGKVL